VPEFQIPLKRCKKLWSHCTVELKALSLFYYITLKQHKISPPYLALYTCNLDFRPYLYVPSIASGEAVVAAAVVAAAAAFHSSLRGRAALLLKWTL
jgi:hypothetical protein